MEGEESFPLRKPNPMNPRQFPSREYVHTNRFKPSQTLIKITQGKMREAETQILKLESRIKTSRSQTEKAQISRCISDLRDKHKEYLSELQLQRAQSGIKAQQNAPNERPQSATARQTTEPQCAPEKGVARPLSASRPLFANPEPQCKFSTRPSSARPSSARPSSARPSSARPSSARPSSANSQTYQTCEYIQKQPPWRPSSARPSSANYDRDRLGSSAQQQVQTRSTVARPSSATNKQQQTQGTLRANNSCRGEISIEELKEAGLQNPFSPRNQTFDQQYGESAADAMRRTVNSRCQLMEENYRRRQPFQDTPNRSSLEQTNRMGCANPSAGRWYDLVKSRREQLKLEESQRLMEQRAMEQRVRSAQRKDIEDKALRKTEHKLRARSETKIYDSCSTFSKIGTADLTLHSTLRSRQHTYAADLDRSMTEETQRKRQQHLKDHETWASQTGLPSDRFDANGAVIRHAIPERYYQGIEFSNQAKQAPKRTSFIRKHEQHVAQSRTDAIEEARQVEHIGKRNADRMEQKEKQKIQRAELLRQVQEVALSNKTQVERERYGSMRLTTDWEITHGPSYQSTNRRLNPTNGRGDAQFDQSCFIDRMTRADEQHKIDHSYNVLPLTEEEARSRSLNKYLQKNPHRRTLDSDDMRVVYNYITDQKEMYESRRAKVGQMEQYSEQLKASQKEQQRAIDQRMSTVEFDFNATPQYLKNRFW